MPKTLFLTIFCLISLTSLLSCNGKASMQKANSTKLTEQVKRQSKGTIGKNIMVVFHDSKNNYWFGSWEDGLYKYDGDTILHYTTVDGLPSNRVEEIKEDKLGNIYFNTTQGLCKYDKGRFSPIVEAKSDENDWKLHADDLWFKCLTHRASVYRFDGQHFYRLKLPKTKLGEDYIAKHHYNTSPYTIYCTYKDSHASVWVGTAQLGVCRYNGKTFDWISEDDVTELHDGPSNGVRGITEDRNGDFWFNTEYRYSVYSKDDDVKYSSATQPFYTRIKSIGQLDGMPLGGLNEYLSIAKDNNNDLWIATYIHGVWKFDGRNIKHFPIQVQGKTPQLINQDNRVVSIPIFYLYKDKHGDMWLGTHENGVWKFNGQAFEEFAP